MNYAYLRVSKGTQDVESQKFGILAYANAKGLSKLNFIEDVISSRVAWKERAIGQLVEKLKPGDLLIAAETTRLGRSISDVLDIQKEILSRGAVIHLVKEGMVLGTLGQTELEKLNQQIMLALLGYMGDVERTLISERTREALALAKANGKQLGRPKGAAPVLRLDAHRKEIESYLAKGISAADVARLLDVGTNTMYRYLKRRGIKLS